MPTNNSAKLAARGRQFLSLPLALGQNEEMIFRLVLPSLIALRSFSLLAAELDPVLDTAERYMQLQTQGIPGKVSITMGHIDATRLPACTAHEAFAPPGMRLIGKSSVGVRCLGPTIWSVLVPVQISITGNYVITARPLAAGQVLQGGDLTTISGDLSTLPNGILNDPAGAIGKTLRNSLSSGQPLRSDQLLAQLVIRQGQSVRVISKGTGFAVSTEGKAVNNATEGQVVQIRMASGQTVSGVAKADGSVEVSF
jgi:flagellar basal body P-ring formation protein FlgA